MGLLNRAGPWLAAQMQTAAADPAVTVTYVRGAERYDLTGKAWVGRTVFARNSGDGGAAVIFGDRDYLIPVADLAVEPAKGDRIEETSAAGVKRLYDVLPPVGEPAARYSDPARTVWRVHCKYKGTE